MILKNSYRQSNMICNVILPSLGLCLIQIVLTDEAALTARRKVGLVVGVLYVVIGNFLFAQSVVQALMDDIK